MKNVFFLLLCIHFLLAKDLGNLKKGNENVLLPEESFKNSNQDSSSYSQANNNLGANLSLTTNSPNTIATQFNREMTQIVKMKDELIKNVDNKNKERVDFTVPKDEVEKLRPKPEDFVKLDVIMEKLKLNVEFMVTMLIAMWNKIKVDESDSFPLTKGTKIHVFYIAAFPYVIVLSLILVTVILFKLVSKGLNSLLKKENDENQKESKIKNTSPKNKRLSNSENDKTISLKGRVKKIPKPINYKELFGGVESINQANQKKEEIKQNLKAEESFCSIDDFFDKVNLKKSLLIDNNVAEAQIQHENLHVKESENLLCFDDFDFKLPVKQECKEIVVQHNVEKETIIEPLPIIYQTVLEPIKEEPVEEVDQHTAILNRLINSNFIRETAITNYLDRKNSK